MTKIWEPIHYGLSRLRVFSVSTARCTRSAQSALADALSPDGKFRRAMPKVPKMPRIFFRQTNSTLVCALGNHRYSRSLSIPDHKLTFTDFNLITFIAFCSFPDRKVIFAPFSFRSRTPNWHSRPLIIYCGPHFYHPGPHFQVCYVCVLNVNYNFLMSKVCMFDI